MIHIRIASILLRVSPILVLPSAGLAAALLLGTGATEASQPGEDKASASALVSDSTIDFSHGADRYFEYFAPDGTSRGGDGAGSLEAGKWYVRDDATVCFIHRDPNQSGCVFVRRVGAAIEFRRIDGVVEGPFAHLRGNPKGL